MKLVVCGMKDAATLLGHELKNVCQHVISITDLGYVVRIDFAGRQVLRLDFDDVEQSVDGYHPIQPFQLKSVIAFVRNLPPKSVLLVHCAQGISRSPAIALCASLARHSTQDLHGAVNTVLHSCRSTDTPRPNKLIVAMTDSTFGLSGELLSTVRSEMASRGISY